MKKHNAFKVILITLAAFLLLSWILPVAVFQTSYQEQGRVQMGLFDIFSYQTTALSYFGQLALFVLVIGGFYGVVSKTGAYRRMLDAIVKKFKGKEGIALSIIMVLFAVITSMCGLQMGLLIFFPLVISLVLMMGYSKLAAIAVTVGSVLVGMMGTTFASSTIVALTQYLSLEITDAIWAKVIILVLGLVILIINVLKFGKKENKKVAEDKDDFIPVAVKGHAKKVWPLVVILDLILLVMILSFISWNSAFGISLFDEITSSITGFKLPAFVPLLLLLILVNVLLLIKKKYKPTIIVDGVSAVIFVACILIAGWKAVSGALMEDFTIFGKLLGTISSFGNWSIGELCTVLLLGSILLKFAYKIKFDDAMDAFIAGAKKALLPAVLIVLIYSGLVITTYHPFQLVIYKAILGITKGFNVFTTGLVAILAALFNVEPTYAFQSVVPFLASIVSEKELYPIIGVIFQSLYAVVMLVAPTSVLLMVSLSYLKVSYKDWMKYIWKILLEFIVILFVIFTILMLF